MSRDLMSMLRYEAKKRPQIAAALNDISSISEEEIQALPVLKWIRQALMKLKMDNISSISTNAAWDRIKNLLVDIPNSDPIGEIRRWSNGNEYVTIGKSMLEMKYNQLVFILPNGVWIDTIFSPKIDQKLFTYTVSLGQYSRTRYEEIIREERNKTVIQDTSNITTTQSGLRFQIFR